MEKYFTSSFDLWTNSPQILLQLGNTTEMRNYWQGSCTLVRLLAVSFCYKTISRALQGHKGLGRDSVRKNRLGLPSRLKSLSSTPSFSCTFACVLQRTQCKTTHQTLRKKTNYRYHNSLVAICFCKFMTKSIRHHLFAEKTKNTWLQVSRLCKQSLAWQEKTTCPW